MKTEKIEELFNKYSENTVTTDDYGDQHEESLINYNGLKDAINQLELEWYKKLLNNLNLESRINQ